MSLETAIPCAALVVSVVSLIWAQISANQIAAKSADQSYVSSLEKRIEMLELDNQRLTAELDKCVTVRDSLQRETVELLRQLAKKDTLDDGK